MGISITKKLNVGFLLALTFLLAVVSFSATASAQEDNAEASEPDTSEQSGTSFEYVAQPGDNLTKLARRSVELAASNAAVELNAGQAIAAETMIVDQLGGYELNVGQDVSISEQLVTDAISSATNLSDTAVSRWASYGPITRSVASNPVSGPDYLTEEDTKQPEPEPETTPDNGENGEVAAEGAGENSSDQAVEIVSEGGDSKEDDENAPWYWWLIGGGALGAMWYVLGGSDIIKNRRK